MVLFDASQIGFVKIMICSCHVNVREERMVHIHHDVFDGDEKPKSCVGRPKERMNAKAKSN